MPEALPSLARRITIRERQSLALSQASASVALNHIIDAAENIRIAAAFLDKACRARPELARALDGVPHVEFLELIARDLGSVATRTEEAFA